MADTIQATRAPETSAAVTERARNLVWLFGIFVCLLAARLAHAGVLWVDEAYPLAAFPSLARGATLYGDVWFDKPPLYAWVYQYAVPLVGLRMFGALFAWLNCALAMGLASHLFGPREGRAAAALLAFFLIFDTPSAVVPVAPDMLTIPFALGAVWLVATRNFALGGLVAGAALLANAKVLFLLPALLFWSPRAWLGILGGYVAGALIGPALLAINGTLADYWQQVWVWGARYSSDTPMQRPLGEGVVRTANWIGFHAALLVPASVYLLRRPVAPTPQLALWFLCAFAAVFGGWRFYPRYYFALLPVAAILGSAGLFCIPKRWRVGLLVVALAIPAIRFGKPQVQLAADLLASRESSLSDLAMEREARAAAAFLRSEGQPGDTLLVWGYRPELNTLAQMRLGTRFLDSQPLTGVIADRHLTRSDVTYPELAAENRRALRNTRPTWIADGLGPYNPQLAIGAYPDLAEWLANYEVAAEMPGFRLYRRKPITR